MTTDEKVVMLRTALADLLKVIAVDDLIPESVSYMCQAREALEQTKITAKSGSSRFKGVTAHTTMLVALKDARRLFDEALPKFNWSASSLDANAIALLNEVPTTVAKAIKAGES